MPKKPKEQKPRRAISFGETALARVRNDESVALVDGFTLTPNGLSVSGDPGFERCAAVGRLLPIAEVGIQFAIGDYILYMEAHFNEEASQIIDYTEGWSETTCRIYRWMAERVEPDRRRMDRLKVNHHLAVAPLSPLLQTKWLTRAANDDEEKPWTVARLKAEMSGAGELKPTYWLTVSADSEADQAELQAQMEAAGRSCKATVRRRRSKP